MEKGLKIIGDQIEFKKWSTGDIWFPCITKSFKIRFDDIKIVAISPRLALDNEMLLVTLIDKEKNFSQFSNFEFEGEAYEIFENKLSLSIGKEWSEFSWKEHENYITDLVIYPNELKGEDLFVKPKYLRKSITQLLKFLYLKKSISGKLSPKVEEYLNK